MDILTYAALSALIIMFWHFAMNTKTHGFGIMQMIGIFVFGGFIGWYMDSLMLGIVFSIGMALFF